MERAADENSHCGHQLSHHLYIAMPCRGPQPSLPQTQNFLKIISHFLAKSLPNKQLVSRNNLRFRSQAQQNYQFHGPLESFEYKGVTNVSFTYAESISWPPLNVYLSFMFIDLTLKQLIK